MTMAIYPYSYGLASKKRIAECHPKLQDILNEAIQFVDIAVVTGHRNKEEQDRVFNQGLSKVKWPNGKHNSVPSLAFDVYPFWPEFGPLMGTPEQLKRIASYFDCSPRQAEDFVLKELYALARILKGVALKQGVPLRWGGDWDNDWNTYDQRFNDLGHFELANSGA